MFFVPHNSILVILQAEIDNTRWLFYGDGDLFDERNMQAKKASFNELFWLAYFSNRINPHRRKKASRVLFLYHTDSDAFKSKPKKIKEISRNLSIAWPICGDLEFATS